MTGLLTTKQADKTAGMKAVSAALTGGDWPDIFDELKTLDGAELDAAFAKADQAAAAAPENFALRMEAAYAYALARDFHYTVASAQRFYYARGAQEAIRGLYGVGVIDILATTTAS